MKRSHRFLYAVLAFYVVLTTAALTGCSDSSTYFNGYTKDNLVVEDAKGRYYTLRGNYNGNNETYYLLPITNVTFALPEKR